MAIENTVHGIFGKEDWRPRTIYILNRRLARLTVYSYVYSYSLHREGRLASNFATEQLRDLSVLHYILCNLNG